MSRLDEIRARVQAATPGPWRVAQGSSGCNWIDGSGYDEVLSPDAAECMAYCYGGSSRINLADVDADLIAHAPDDLAYLLAEVERLTEAERHRDLLLTGFFASCPDKHEHGVWCGSAWVALEQRAEKAETERDALAATVARVEALAEEWADAGWTYDAYLPAPEAASKIRAALTGDRATDAAGHLSRANGAEAGASATDVIPGPEKGDLA